jgi:hypothetical protein
LPEEVLEGDDDGVPGGLRVELLKKNEVKGVLDPDLVELVFDVVEWLDGRLFVEEVGELEDAVDEDEGDFEEPKGNEVEVSHGSVSIKVDDSVSQDSVSEM